LKSKSPIVYPFHVTPGIDKKPSGLVVHLISLRNISEKSDRGALSMPKKNHETHHLPYGTFNTTRSNQDDSGSSLDEKYEFDWLILKKNPNFFSLLKFVEKHRGAPGCIGLAKSRPSTRPELATSKTRPKKSLFFFTNRGLIGATLIGAEP
jgi:hypothetical protein